ncbi:uncharacterized protein Pyn_17635 [Prunus yedoensis var. nudiflora]|uniref:Uncharacterized protein n=1 Tax=Prunus yedoensis var. nudiflora TaxID=2094558 RepID=A0A314U9Y4_PRUYE|nr:uncharacterized protein Pyn_17635 [Prunus yedoensis var. nudiflora]
MRKYYEYWTSVRRWRTHEPELHPYFVLGDLWESFKDWSAYGALVTKYVGISILRRFLYPKAHLTKKPTERKALKLAKRYRARRKDTYTQMELDEVREELASHVQEWLFD